MDIDLVILGTAALLLRAGFGLYASGSLRAQNGGIGPCFAMPRRRPARWSWAVGAAVSFKPTTDSSASISIPCSADRTSSPTASSSHLAIVLIGGAIARRPAERARFMGIAALSAVLAATRHSDRR